MKQVIRLTESDIHGIVKQIINETLNEHGIGLVGMHQAAADNLKNRHRLGQRHRRLPKGKIQNNKERFNKAKQQIKQEIMDEYLKEFGEEGVDLTCSCWYFKSYAYEFTFHLNGIEQINTHNFSIYGDILDIDASNLAQTLKSAIVPKQLTNVVLVYNLANRTISFTTKKSGLVIKPEDEGETGWSRLLGLVGDFLSAYMKIAR